MKKFVLIFLILASVAFAGLTYDQDNYKKNLSYVRTGSQNDPVSNFINEIDGILGGTGTTGITNLLFDSTITSDPTSTEGRLYYNTTDNLFKFYNGSSWVDIEANTGGLSMNGTYNLGGDITVDNGVMTWTAPDSADNVILTLAQSDTGTSKGLVLTNAGSGNTVDIQGTSGNDIQGTGDTWEISTVGLFTSSGGITLESGGDLTLTGAATNLVWDSSESTLEVVDNTYVAFGTGDDVTMQFDATNFEVFAAAADTPFALGGTAAGFDLTYAFETAGQFRTDYDGDFINLTDDMDLRFGTGASSDGDFSISSNSSNVLNISQVVADTGTMTIGADGTDIPLTWYAETAGAEIVLTGDTVTVDGVDVTMNDADSIIFGDSTDASIQWSGSLLKVDAVTTTAGTALQLETTDGGIHLNADGAANGDILIDAADVLTFTSVDTKVFDGAAAETWIIEGTADAHEATVVFTDPTADITWTFPTGATDTLAVMSSTLATNIPEAANSVTGGTNTLIYEGSTADDFETTLASTDPTADNALTLPDDSGEVAYTPTGGTTYGAGAGALPVTHAYVAYTSVGAAEALTLADGKPGQIITIAHVTDGGNGVITPATAAGWTSVDLADDGDMITLVFVDTVGWAVMGTAGVAAPPALTVP